MGMRILSKSSYDRIQYIDREVTVHAPNPNPSNFEILQKGFSKSGYLILKVHYPDCTNYEGIKILVYKNDKILTQETIDPHFSENEKFESPIARFEPTEFGWELAKKL